MTSSMLAGEKRWASTRSRGMTVLGKVAVPKPLNLPSQRLENHGLDPNVEIVPKGTLSWGSRSSTSASNAWGSSTLSPNTDGGTSSPSHLSGRPSSGSGTRPSTAGSDRTHEPIPNAWGQSSRPSSASGAVTSNQSALTSLRPRSAETRPGSSQLSRFAESSSDNSVAWGPTGVSEKLGGGSSKNDGFSLSSGDFPTLGSERENPGKNTDTQDHCSCGRPGSSSGRAVAGKEKTITSSGDNSVNANVPSGAVNTWKRDNPQHVEDGVQPTVEKWQGDPPPYLNANVPPQHFDTWHGPPMNPPPGVWYRGPPGGPPYAPPMGPGGFPIEPFPYYRPQMPPAALANSQPVPPPGAGPRGHHPKNGDLYRPHIPDAYIRPGMPIRPGFYPGPVAYEGYYGPPMGYCNSSDRDIPFMGIAAGPSVYNRYPGDTAADPSNSHHARAGPHGPTVKASASERVESGHPDDTPYKVLLKQHNEWDEKQGEDRWEHAAPANVPYVGKGDQQKPSSRKDEWGLEDGKDEENYLGRRILGGDASRNFDNRENSADPVKVKLPANKGKGKAVNERPGNRSESSVSAFSQAPQMFPSAAKDPTLIQKIEGLNAKVRASDGQPDIAAVPSRDEQKNRSQVGGAKASSFVNESGTDLRSGKTHAGVNIIPCSDEVDIDMAADKVLQLAASGLSGMAFSRKTNHGVQNRLDNRGKRFNSQDGDGWRKKSHAVESTGAISEPSLNVHVQDCLPSAEAADKYGTDIQGKDEGESSTPMFDPSDGQAQRSKMREIAKQRVAQLQREEEERTKEQKAKALAKLEELNRRTQVVGSSIQKLEKAPPSGPIQQEKERKIPGEQEVVKSKSETPMSPSISTPNALITESNCILVGEYNILSRDTLLETSDNAQHGPSPHGQSLPLQKDDYGAGTADHKAAPLVNEGSVPKHKRPGYKQKQSTSQAKNLNEKSVPVGPLEVPKANTDVAVIDVAPTEVPSCEPSLPVGSNVVAEPSAHQRRKSNRSSKNKHKLDDVSAATALPSAVSKEINSEKSSTESAKPKTPELDPCSVIAITDDKQAVQASEQSLSLPSEEFISRGNSQWKPQHSRRVSRNQQGNRSADKLHGTDALIWAPVRSQNKVDTTIEASDKTVPDTVIVTAKSDTVVHNNLKSKRAEMERYVPKPKELAQQGSIQYSVPQTPSDSAGVRIEPPQNIEGSQPGESATGRNGDDRQNKQSKTLGSWRQKVLLESDLGRNIQNEKYNPGIKSSDDSNTPDGWYTSENSETVPPVMSTLVKDQAVVAGRGKRNQFRGHKSAGDSRENDHRNVNRGDMDKSFSQSPAPEMAQTDESIASKVSHGPGERASQWQPKSQVYSVHNNQRGIRPVGGHNITAEVKDLPPEDVAKPPMDQPLSEQKNVMVTPNAGQQEFKRERRVSSFRGRPLSPNQSSNRVEPPPPASVDSQNEQQRFSSGFRKNGNQNSRLGKGHESRGDWTSSGQDNRPQHNTSSSRERQRHNSHYEYQPIGQYNSNKSNNEGPRDSSHGTGQHRYRERSQGQQRRGGNFYARQSGSAPLDGGYD